MAKHTVLICDPDTDFCAAADARLQEDGFATVLIHRGDAMIAELDGQKIDLIIMETILPDISGTEVCRRLRLHSNVPIIFVSSRAGELDRILGLKMGADDYMAKPCSLAELSVRVEAILRRTATTVLEKRVNAAELALYPDSYTVYIDGKLIPLIPSDFKLLSHMAEHLGKVYTREQLLDAVWGLEYYGSSRAIDSQIKRLRKALDRPNVHFAIKTVYGVGYKLELNWDGSKALKNKDNL